MNFLKHFMASKVNSGGNNELLASLKLETVYEITALCLQLAGNRSTRARFFRLVAEIDPKYKLPEDVAPKMEIISDAG
jgi:hypothetical protein